ncbi:MAG: hypothetical protein ABEJ30_08250 [Halorientalis sp.]
MSVSANCEVCTVGEAHHTCTRCGQLVCERHYDEETGFCTECLAEVGGGERQPADRPDGVDTYRS